MQSSFPAFQMQKLAPPRIHAQSLSIHFDQLHLMGNQTRLPLACKPPIEGLVLRRRHHLN